MYDDDLMLPKATVVKAIKQRLPENMKIAHESSEMIMECCNNFIHIITSTANEISEKDKRSTIQPEDVLQAVKELGFDSYVEPLEKGEMMHRCWSQLVRRLSSSRYRVKSCKFHVRVNGFLPLDQSIELRRNGLVVLQHSRDGNRAKRKLGIKRVNIQRQMV